MNTPETHLLELDDRQPDYATMVLLIDDQTTVAKAVQHLLIDAPDIDVHYVSDPMDAIKTANAIKPTVILQDLVMPSIEGIELLKLLRANPATSETPIIMLSSEDNPHIKSRAFAAGANDYLVKLPDKIELIARIRYHSKTCQNQLLREEAFKSLQESQHKLSESNMALISVNRRLEEAHDKLKLRYSRWNGAHAKQAGSPNWLTFYNLARPPPRPTKLPSQPFPGFCPSNPVPCVSRVPRETW